jgi:hypothetical protein
MQLQRSRLRGQRDVMSDQLRQNPKRDGYPRQVRPSTIDFRRMPKSICEAIVRLAPEEYWRPTSRSECLRGPRPCPFVGCRYNLYLDVWSNGNIKLNFPDLEPGEIPPHSSCALDVAGDGPQTLDRVAEVLNVTRERLRQLQEQALARLNRRFASRRSDIL